MVCPMPLICEIFQNLKMAMTKTSEKASVFITPSGMFKWLRIPFGLKMPPDLQRLIDNALYGILKMVTTPSRLKSNCQI